jgi:hypothetical protein
MPRQREVEVEEDDLDNQNDKSSKKVGDFNDDGTLVKDADLEPDEFDDGEDNAIARRQVEEDERRKKKRGGKVAVEDETEEEEVDSRAAYDDDDDDEEPRGNSRRARRNRARREAREQSSAVIAKQEERIRQLEAGMQGMSFAQLELRVGDVDGQIAGMQGQLETIDAAMARAIAEQDQPRIRNALKLRDEANARLVVLGQERQRIEGVARQMAQPQQQQRPQQEQQRQQGQVDVDPVAERFSEKFMDRHPWFDPMDNKDEDSQMVKAIDDTLVNEGYKPNTKRYWVELERRVRSRGLGENDMGEQDMGYSRDDEQDERYERSQRRDRPQRKSGGLPPRSSRGSGGRDSSRDNSERTLPPLAKDTLDQLGLLDKAGLTKEQLAEREGYIKTWQKGLKAARAAGKL